MVPKMSSNLVWRSLACWLIVLIVWSWRDIDECSLIPSLCGDNTVCVNTPGGRECRCLEGYYGDATGGGNCTALLPSSLSVTVPGDVVVGRPYTLQCKITRPPGDREALIWEHIVGHTLCHIYVYRVCIPSIPVLSTTPAWFSWGCQHVNGEEVYTARIENITEDTGQPVLWRCQYGLNISDNVILDIQVMVTRVSLTNPPGTLTAGVSSTFTCVTSPSKPQACISCYIRRSGNVRELDPVSCNPDTSSVQTTTRTLTFTASAEENGAELYCDADNRVTDPPVRSQVYKLDVHFGPDTVQLRADSAQSQNTVTVTFTCTSSESNPAAAFSWYNNKSPIPAAELSEVSSQPGPNLGYLTTQRYTVRVDRYLHGHVIRCEAQRPGQRTPVSSSINLNITEGQFIPDELFLPLCINNEATIVWSSGIDESLVEFYKLEYRGTGDVWEKRLVRNPGRIKVVKTTVTDLQSGVLYRFRLQPYSDLVLESYAHANCTVTGSGESAALIEDPSPGLNKAGMLGVGIGGGVSILALIGLLAICVLLRRGKLTWHREVKPQRDDADPPPMGHYEDLDHSRGPLYEEVPVTTPPPRRSEPVVYENSTVF